MSKPQESHGPLPMVTPEDVKQTNDQTRQIPTRPGWRAGLALVAFFAGLAFYIVHIGT